MRVTRGTKTVTAEANACERACVRIRPNVTIGAQCTQMQMEREREREKIVKKTDREGERVIDRKTETIRQTD